MQKTATLANTGETRERIVRLLQRREHTIEELAQELGFTKNAIRSQINLLRKEGIVEARGTIASGRRPAAIYGVKPGAGNPFSRAYPVVLTQLVRVLAEKLSPEKFGETITELGVRMADLGPRPTGTVNERLRNTVSFLESLGSTVDVVEKKDKVIIRGYGCPIAGTVAADKRICGAMSVMVGKLMDLPVAEKCDKEKLSGCCFEIDATREKQNS